MRLRTTHGTYVVAREGGQLLHLPDVSARDFPSVWDMAPPPVPISGLLEAAVTQGPLAPATMIWLSDGRVAFRRDGLYLCAEPTGPELRFDRAAPGAWERFAIEAADGATSRRGRDKPSAQSPSLARPVLIETLIGYQIVTADAATVVLVRAPEFSKEPINRYTMGNGAWMVDVDSAPDTDQAFLVYWLYPFEARIHVWRLDRSGRRLVGYDLSDTQARSFLSGRRALGAAVTARLYLLAKRADDRATLAALTPDLCAAAEAGSSEALHAVLCDPLAFPPATVRGLAARAWCLIRAANRVATDDKEGHLAQFTVGPLSEALMRLDPGIGGLSHDQFQGEIDFSAYFSDARHLPPGGCTLPFTLHRRTEDDLVRLLGGLASDLTIGILLSPNTKTVEFHYANSHMLPRTLLSIRFAYYVLCTNQANVWSRLAARDSTAHVWMIRLEADDLPLTAGPSVAFERRLGDTNFALVPDPYYFDNKAFRRGWFTGDSPPWNEKATRFLWRGSTTGAGGLTRDTIWLTPRVRLCEIGRALGPVADFGVTNVVQTRSEADVDDIKRALQDQGLWRDPMPQHVMGAAKFLIEIDGNANSWGFLAKLLMGCCVLKVDSPYEQWFYGRLRRWVHYVPVAQDLSDLPNKVNWCLQNEETCRSIAEAGRRFAESLTFDTEMVAATDAFIAVARRVE